MFGRRPGERTLREKWCCPEVVLSTIAGGAPSSTSDDDGSVDSCDWSDVSGCC